MDIFVENTQIVLILFFLVFDPCDYDDCHSNAECTANDDNSFNCTCNSGYTGNGTFCRGSKINMLITLNLIIHNVSS